MSDFTPLPDRIVEQLAAASTATIASQLLSRGLRDQFVTGVTPVASGQRMVGAAWTARTIPSREDLDGLWPGARPASGLSLFDVIESTPAGAVLVIDGRGEHRTATGGDILVERLLVRGARGLVTDAGVRDRAAVSAVGLPCYSAGATANVSRAYLRVAEQDVPIGCGSVAVFPSDALVGDDDGVIVIPRALVEEVAAAAFEQERLEEYIGAKIRAGAPLRGHYPPSAELRAEYEANRP
ncbi:MULTISPECIES: RraA family protein [Streptomyces]|uniref:Putative 4-hydroxy-4-methyl-2-oxoglutarate aldolase n=1 Tax=Streptomyces doudnae TaxID=3075536 RepID=A0ABD5F001_9ACTN|nr:MULTISPECIES: hypothetical protein [unclassified Streptomyces]MDT0440273.1 hypothetical protein [Streptomyces sp. DSM 41981]MYQ62048.1 ribonuclease activity regulator RraA [Streptomyces sp. SID4950]SCD29409.1 Regulator of RNase E activity RraA [Streptomyces sp. SolWspMP-5a-2]